MKCTPNVGQYDILKLGRSSVLEAGSYEAFPLFEDYWLWVRVLIREARARNLPQVLVKARAGEGMLARRGRVEYAKKQIAFQMAIYRIGFISFPEFLFNVCVRSGTGIVPAWARRLIYTTLRNSSIDG